MGKTNPLSMSSSSIATSFVARTPENLQKARHK
jgi:hypothetical protein